MDKNEALQVIRSNYPTDRNQLCEALETLIPELKESEYGKPCGGIVLEDFNGGEGFYKVNLAYLNKEQVIEIEELVKKWNPKLKESEDEKIRKGLIDFLKSPFVSENITDEKVTPWIDWLEKQGEQNSANKVERKFHKGDWITIDNPCQIMAIDENYIVQYCDDEKTREISKKFCEYQFHLWTIQDAKDGDVLAYNDGHGNDSIELIKSITDKKIEFWFCLTNGNRYEVSDGIIPYTNLVSRENATPATKEQRDLLFQKIKEAGYEWDIEKKELKIIEQKSDWSEEDEKMFENIFETIDTYYYIISDYKKMLSWLKSIKERMEV